MSVPQPGQSVRGTGKSGSSMKVPLHSGKAFPVSSSSSSSSSSFCPGESSPESLRSLSSLSGVRTDSPLDYDLLEVTLMTTVMSTTERTGDVVISKWVLEEKNKKQDDNTDVSVGKIQTEVPESNDNSASFYLDANSSEYRTDNWSANLTVALSRMGNNCEFSSSAPDSMTDMCPGDFTDEEDEALFLSVSSDVSAWRSSVTCTNMEKATSEHRTEGVKAESAHNEEPSKVMFQRLEQNKAGEEVKESFLATWPTASEDLIQISSAASTTSPGFLQVIERSAASSNLPGEDTSQTLDSAKTKPTTASKPSMSNGIRASKGSEVDLKTVPAKVGSCSAPSPSKTQSQNKSASANAKRAHFLKEEVPPAGSSKRLSAGPVKGAVVLKPIRGKNTKASNVHTNHRTRAGDRRTRSTSGSSLGSEGAEDGQVGTAGKLADKHRGVRSVEPKCGVWVGVIQDPVDEGREAEPFMTVQKPRSGSSKVSSKLGPNGRPHGKGTRVEKGASRPVPPAGLGTGPPGHHGPRQTHSDGSVSGESGGSPTRLKPSPSQSQGMSRPRITSVTSTACSSKTTANQPPTSGTAGRPAAATASKLPIKGLPTILGSSSQGSNTIENNEATSKGPTTPPGNELDEHCSSNTLPVGSQRTATPPGTSSPAPIISTDRGGPKALPMRSRALSLQARTTTGLKAPAVNSSANKTTAAANQTTAKTAVAANQGVAKLPSQKPLQRSSSTRLSRLNSTVDKNKPREVLSRAPHGSSLQVSGTNQNQNQQNQKQIQQKQPDLVTDEVKVNASVMPVSRGSDTPDSVSAGPSTLGFKIKTGFRSDPKTGSRLQNGSRFSATAAYSADETISAKPSHGKEQAEKKNQALSQLRRFLVQGNKRVEALATVIQHLFAEREEAMKQKKALCVELANLRDELASSSQSCTRLLKEKEEVRCSLEEDLKRLEEQHQEEVQQLEERLRSFYQTEWDKVHQTYQEEAEKCRMWMEQQVEELRTGQEAERKNQEVSHIQRVESLKQQYEICIEEMKGVQQMDLEILEKTLKDTEASLSEKVSELSAEKEALNERLKTEEERRRSLLSDKSLKDSHTLYLEQELESLKVVLEIKNNQLHQREKKLMEMDKLVETNVKLEEELKKVQQENEDYKARMDKHAALSKQLSSEQAILQQTLQNESKVNKRLSMENEELLWKLHNGDLLASPRHLSPTSPFSSPAAPLSPR